MSKDYFKNVTTFFTTKKTESKSSSDVPKKKEQVQAASDALDVARAIDNRPAREFKKNLIDAIKELNGRCKKRGGESFEMFFNIQFKRMTETIGKKIEEDFESETGLRLELDYETARVQWQGEDRTLRDIGWKILEYTLQDQGTDLLVVFDIIKSELFGPSPKKKEQYQYSLFVPTQCKAFTSTAVTSKGGFQNDITRCKQLTRSSKLTATDLKGSFAFGAWVQLLDHEQYKIPNSVNSAGFSVFSTKNLNFGGLVSGDCDCLSLSPVINELEKYLAGSLLWEAVKAPISKRPPKKLFPVQNKGLKMFLTQWNVSREHSPDQESDGVGAHKEADSSDNDEEEECLDVIVVGAREFSLEFNCGTGKTLLSLHMVWQSGLLLKSSSKYPIIAFVPHLRALRSFLEQWIVELPCILYKEHKKRRIRSMFVGSEIHIPPETDKFEWYGCNESGVTFETPVRTTDQKTIDKWYKNSITADDNSFISIVFSTYKSGGMMSQYYHSAAIFDEAHTIVGAVHSQSATGERDVKENASVFMGTKAYLRISMSGSPTDVKIIDPVVQQNAPKKSRVDESGQSSDMDVDSGSLSASDDGSESGSGEVEFVAGDSQDHPQTGNRGGTSGSVSSFDEEESEGEDDCHAALFVKDLVDGN
eukprot:g1816.t1